MGSKKAFSLDLWGLENTIGRFRGSPILASLWNLGLGLGRKISANLDRTELSPMIRQMNTGKFCGTPTRFKRQRRHLFRHVLGTLNF